MGMSFMINGAKFHRTLLNIFEKSVLHNFWLFVRKLDVIRLSTFMDNNFSRQPIRDDIAEILLKVAFSTINPKRPTR
jgi:hypothetical protein